MSDNLSQYLVRIRRYLKEETAANSHWTDDFLKQAFNAQYRLRCSELQNAYEGWFVLVAQRDIEANVARYSWPPDFQRLTKMEVVRDDGRTVPLERYERHGQINPVPVSGGDGYLPTYRPLANGFVLEPTSQTSVTNGLRIEFEGLPTELSANNDTLHPSFPNQLDELLVLDTVIVAFDQEGQQESGQARSILRLRAEWDDQWLRFIDRRVIHRPSILPFIPHDPDA
jgi:hypothetical protein